MSDPIRRELRRALTPRSNASPVPVEAPVKFDGDHSRQWWATRDDGEINSIEAFWNTRTNPARSAIGEVIAELDGLSLLEVGCHAGPNLWAAAHRKQFANISGTDLSPKVIEFARAKLSDELNSIVNLQVAEASDLPFADRAFDMTLLSVVLCCVGPEQFDRSFREILRVSSRWLIIAEPFDDNPQHATADGLPDHYPNTTYWIRNYIKLLDGRAMLRSVRHLPVEHQMGHLRCIMVFELI